MLAGCSQTYIPRRVVCHVQPGGAKGNCWVQSTCYLEGRVSKEKASEGSRGAPSLRCSSQCHRGNDNVRVAEVSPLGSEVTQNFQVSSCFEHVDVLRSVPRPSGAGLPGSGAQQVIDNQALEPALFLLSAWAGEEVGGKTSGNLTSKTKAVARPPFSLLSSLNWQTHTGGRCVPGQVFKAGRQHQERATVAHSA